MDEIKNIRSLLHSKSLIIKALKQDKITPFIRIISFCNYKRTEHFVSSGNVLGELVIPATEQTIERGQRCFTVQNKARTKLNLHFKSYSRTSFHLNAGIRFLFQVLFLCKGELYEMSYQASESIQQSLKTESCTLCPIVTLNCKVYP